MKRSGVNLGVIHSSYGLKEVKKIKASKIRSGVSVLGPDAAVYLQQTFLCEELRVLIYLLY